MRTKTWNCAAAVLGGLAVTAHAGLIASYPFEEGSLADSSGNGNDAAVVGTAIAGATSDETRGDVFDLTGGSGTESNPGNYLELPVSGNETGSWTLAMWIHDGETTKSYLFDNRDLVGREGGAATWLILSTEYNVGSGAGIKLYSDPWSSATIPVRDGNWHHVAWAYSADSDTVTFYTDGTAETATDDAVVDLLGATVRLGNRNADGGNAQTDRLIDDVYVYDHSLSQSEIDALIAATTPAVPSSAKLEVELVGAELQFTWNSNEGMLYDLLSSTTLDSPVASWMAVDGQTGISADPSGTNTLPLDLPVDPKTFYALAEYDAPPPPPIFEAYFEDDDGGFVYVDYSDGSGTAWAWGIPDSDNEFGSVVTTGNGDGTKCWGVNLGDFTATADRGFYNATASAGLRSPSVDLTAVSAATLSFAHAMDVEINDTAELVFLDADDGFNVLATEVYTDPDDATSEWVDAELAVPAAALGKNVHLEWRLNSVDDNGFIGWYVDDVVLSED